jgi:hypothetical protein
MSEITEVDSFEPDYKGQCESCGVDANLSPLVTAWKHGRMVASTGLCGPCCWGEAAMLDPREWNE